MEEGQLIQHFTFLSSDPPVAFVNDQISELLAHEEFLVFAINTLQTGQLCDEDVWS